MQANKFKQSVLQLFNEDNFNNPQAIWAGMQGSDSQQNIAYFCYKLFECIVGIDKKKANKWDKEKLLSTLLVLEVYKNKKVKKKSVIDDIKKLFQKPDIRGQTKWILQVFTGYYKEQEFIQSLISQWTLFPYYRNKQLKQTQDDPAQEIFGAIYQMSINDPNNKQAKHYVLLKHLSFPPRLLYEPKVLAFSYICYLDYIRNHDNCLSEKAYQHIRDIFIGHIHALEKYTITKQYLLTIVHIIQCAITYYGCPYQNILKDLIIWADQLRNCPDYLGEIGQNLFYILHNQLKSPGNSFRRKIRADFPSLDIVKSKNLNKQVYVVSSNNEDWFSRPEHCSINTLRKLIIMHIIKVSGIPQDIIIKYYRIIQSLDKELTFSLYFKMMKILDLSSTMEIYERIRKVQFESITQLMNQVTIQFQKSKKQSSILQVQDFTQLYRDGNPQGIFQYPSYEIVHISIDNFISKKSPKNFVNIVKKNIEDYPKLNFYQNKIPIIFYGDGFDFSKILMSLAQYFENIDYEHARNLKIFYLPNPSYQYRSGIALFLSYIDIWYKRFIYEPFRQRLLFPHIDLSKNKEDLFPAYLMNKSFHMFVRQAKRIYPLKVYKCYIQLTPSKDQYDRKKQQTIMLYFCSSILIGSSVQIQINRVAAKKQKYSNLEVIQILNEKIKVNENYVKMKAICYDQIKKKRYQKNQDCMKIQDIQIVNVPRFYFMGKKPNPAGPHLQMTILLDNYGKTFRKQIYNKDIFKKIPEIQIVQAFKDLFISLTIQELTLERVPGKPSFTINVDGRVIKDVEKIQIQPAKSKNDLHISLPLMTFLPYQTQ